MKNEMSSYFEDPEFKESLARYEGMAENHTPTYFDADELTDIAEYYASKGRHNDADKVIAFALQLHPGDTDALIFKARSLALKGKIEEAYRVAGLIEDTTDREVKFLQADLLMEENRIEEADKIFEQLARDEEYDKDTLLDIMLAYIDANQEKYADKWHAQLALHTDLTVLPEKSQRFRDVLCDYYITFNRPTMAIPFLRSTLDRHPYSIRHWNELGKCYLQSGEYENAHEAFDFALAIDDTDKETLALKAFCYRQNGHLQEACEYYLRLAKVSENKASVYLALAKVYFDMRNYNSSIDYIQKLLKHKSELTRYELAELDCDIALCHASLGHTSTGYPYIYEAISLNEHDPDIRISAGHFFLIESGNGNDPEKKENDLDNAETQFEYALKFSAKEERCDTLFTIASACFDVQNYKYANRYFRLINEEFPDNARSTYFFMIYGYFYLQQLTPFMHYLAKIKEEIPEMYAALGNDTSMMLSDSRFNELMREMKENISNGKIDLNKYL